MLTRSGLDWTARFRPIAAALAVPKIRAAYLDGEIAVMGENGVTSFAALQDALSRGQGERLTFHVFDLLLLAPLIAGESRQSIFPAVQIERRGPRPRPSSDPSPV
jgi:ATP-dependent DNA ligase